MIAVIKRIAKVILMLIFNLRPGVSIFSKNQFLDALASLDFKVSLSQRFTFFTASVSTGLSDFFSAIYVLALEFLFSQCCLFRIGSVLP